MINSVFYSPGAKISCFNISNFYLETPLDRPEYVCVKLANIPQYFIEECNLTKHACDGWVYFEIRKGVYGLPQSDKLTNDILHTRLEKNGYYEAANTPGLWHHNWHPFQFVPIVVDFGVEYVGENHAQHLVGVLK